MDKPIEDNEKVVAKGSREPEEWMCPDTEAFSYHFDLASEEAGIIGLDIESVREENGTWLAVGDIISDPFCEEVLPDGLCGRFEFNISEIFQTEDDARSALANNIRCLMIKMACLREMVVHTDPNEVGAYWVEDWLVAELSEEEDLFGISPSEVRKEIERIVPPWTIYWVRTRDHDEDWFVVARTPMAAEIFFEQYEGYSRGMAVATMVVKVPDHMQEKGRLEHPSHELIQLCGGEFITLSAERTILHEQMGVGQRAVKFGEEIFVEGDIVENTAARLSKADSEDKGGRPPN